MRMHRAHYMPPFCACRAPAAGRGFRSWCWRRPCKRLPSRGSLGIPQSLSVNVGQDEGWQGGAGEPRGISATMNRCPDRRPEASTPPRSPPLEGGHPPQDSGHWAPCPGVGWQGWQQASLSSLENLLAQVVPGLVQMVKRHQDVFSPWRAFLRGQLPRLRSPLGLEQSWAFPAALTGLGVPGASSRGGVSFPCPHQWHRCPRSLARLPCFPSPYQVSGKLACKEIMGSV